MNIKQLLISNDKNKLCKNLKNLLKIHTLFIIALGLSNIFLNIFLWKISKDLTLVIKYNMIGFITLPITFIFAGWLGKKIGLRFNLIMGMTIYSLMFIFILLMKHNVTEYIILVGILRGLGSGFYYVSFNVLGYDFTQDKNRDYFFGVLGLIVSISFTISPLIAGFITSYFNNNIGYQIIFFISFTLFFIGSIKSFSIPNTITKSKFYIKYVATLPLKNSNWTRIMLSESFRGMREPKIVSIIVSLLLFMIVQKELIIGNYSFWTYLISTLSCYAAGIIINPKNRTKYLLIGTFTASLISTIFLFKINVLAFWIFGIINAIIINVIAIPHNTISFAVISSLHQNKKRKIEAVIIKEVFLNLGRVFSLLIFVLVSYNTSYIPYFLFLLGLLQIPMWLLLRKIDTTKLKTHILHPTIEHQHNFFKNINLLHLSGNHSIHYNKNY